MIVPAASVGYSGTETKPAIQIAKSAISHQAQFFDRIAMRAPGSKPCCCRKAAIRRDSSTMSFQLNSLSSPLPIGWVNTVRSGALRSQWYRRWRAREDDRGGGHGRTESGWALTSIESPSSQTSAGAASAPWWNPGRAMALARPVSQPTCVATYS